MVRLNLFDYGMTWEEPDMSHLGDLILEYIPSMECGEWKFWVIDDWISEDWIEYVGEPMDLPGWHLCTDCCATEGGDSQYCMATEIELDLEYRAEEWGKDVWICSCTHPLEVHA